MNGVSRRAFLGYGAALGFAGSALGGPGAPVAQAAGQPARTPGNPLGSRWPHPSERYFYADAAEWRAMERTDASIAPGDVDGFDAAWTALARQEEHCGELMTAAARHVTGHHCFLRASNYYSQVQNLFLRLGDGDRMARAHRRMTAAFNRAWQQVAPPFEAVQIPFGDRTLPGLFFRADQGPELQGSAVAPGPAVLELSGIDHIKERAFFRWQWMPYRQRGLHYLSIDGPGQGESLVNGMPLRPDSEIAARAAIDWLVGRAEVDPKRIGIFGTSFGGYFAPRAAAGDERLKAMASRSAVYDAQDDAFDFCPMIRHQLRLLVDASTLDEARQKLRRFTLAGVVDKIRCPVFITHGSRDDIVSVDAAKKLEAGLRGQHHRVWIVEGAGHNPGRESEIEQIDWISRIL